MGCCDHLRLRARQRLNVLLPHLAGAVVERIERTPAGVRIWARTDAEDASCWSCGSPPRGVHSRYGRSLADVPVADQPVELRVRRFFCDQRVCSVRMLQESS